MQKKARSTCGHQHLNQPRGQCRTFENVVHVGRNSFLDEIEEGGVAAGCGIEWRHEILLVGSVVKVDAEGDGAAVARVADGHCGVYGEKAVVIALLKALPELDGIDLAQIHDFFGRAVFDGIGLLEHLHEEDLDSVVRGAALKRVGREGFKVGGEMPGEADEGIAVQIKEKANGEMPAKRDRGGGGRRRA